MFAPAMTWQSSLFGASAPAVDDAASTERLALDDGSWVDMTRGWIEGADALFAELHHTVEWQCPTVSMYERRVAQPRLSAWFRFDGGPLPAGDLLGDLRARLCDAYGEDFDSVGFNLYRDGHDSVAWHGDRHAKVVADPVVAILTVGSARPFLLRPRGGGSSIRLVPHPGDLVVMGGACQHRWEHSVPKVRSVGPRLSITFRHGASHPDRSRSRTTSGVMA